MRSNCKKKSKNEYLLYLFVFACLLAVTFFTRPQLDEYIFSNITEFNIKSMWDYCINYGSGRILGNMLCTIISHIHQIRFIFISSITLCLVILINKLLFNGKVICFIPTLLLVIFPSADIYRAIYRDLPAFINYAVPIVLWLLSFLIIKQAKIVKEKRKKSVLLFLSSIIVFASCLFSENTTIVIFVSFLLNYLNGFIFNKKSSLFDTMDLFSATVGCFTLFFIPKISDVSDKLDFYRGISTTLDDIVYNLFLFSSRISSWFFVLIFMSAVLSYVIIETRVFNFYNSIRLFVLSLYPFVSILNQEKVFDRFVLFVLTLAYALVMLSVILGIKDKKTKIIALELCFLICCSIGPLMIVKLVVELGNRLNFFTCMLFIILALFLLKEQVQPQKRVILSKNEKRAVWNIQILALLFIFLLIFYSNAKSFNAYIRENQDSGAKVVDVEGDIKFAIENRSFLDTQKSVLWPKEDWIDVLG